MTSTPRILFISPTRLGDAILATSALASLTKEQPNARITIACSALAMPLFEDWPNVERRILLTHKPMAGHWLTLWATCVLTRWDTIVDIRGSAIAYLLWARRRFVWRSKDTETHRVTQLQRMMRGVAPHAPHLFLKQERLGCVQAGPLIATAPAANWQGKEWPLARFEELLARLRTLPQFENAQIAVFGAPQERERLEPLLKGPLAPHIIDCVGTLPLLDSAAYISHAQLFVGNDSGLMHMAAAVGIPTVGLFGPSRMDHYGPYGPRGLGIRTDESYETLMHREHQGFKGSLLTSLSTDTVFGHIHAFIMQRETTCA